MITIEKMNKKKDRTIGEVARGNPLKVHGERIVAYCDNSSHRGVIDNYRKYNQCKRRQCDWLYTFVLGERR